MKRQKLEARVKRLDFRRNVLVRKLIDATMMHDRAVKALAAFDKKAEGNDDNRI
jgi:hypothetical protein